MMEIGYVPSIIERIEMKKALLGTSALVAVALAGSAAAAAQAPSMQITGTLDYHLATVSDSQETGADLLSGNRGKGISVKSHIANSELRFSGSGESEDGHTYGAVYEISPLIDGGVAVDEAYVHFSGSWGKVTLGDAPGPLNSQMAGFNALPLGGIDSGRYQDFFASGATEGADSGDLIGESSDASKITYTTPSLNGLSAMVSFTPDGENTFSSGSRDDDGGFDNIIEVGIDFSHEVDGVAIAIGGDYVSGDSDTVNAVRKNASAWQAGASISSSGFTVAAGFGDRGEGGCGNIPGCENGRFFDIGLGYSVDALSVGLGYFSGDANTTGGAEDEVTAFSVEGSYIVADGLQAYAGMRRMDFEDGDASSGRTAEGTSVVIGTKITF